MPTVITEPTRNITRWPTTGVPKKIRWNTTYPCNGETVRHQSSVTVAPFLKILGTKSIEKAAKAAEQVAREKMEEFIAAKTGEKPERIKKQAAPQTPVGESIAKFVGYCFTDLYPEEGRTPNYLKQARQNIERYWLPHHGEIPLDQLTARDCQTWWKWLRVTEHERIYTDKKGRITKIVRTKLGLKSAMTIKGYASKILNFAKGQGLVHFNFMESVLTNQKDLEEYKRRVRTDKVFFNADQLKLIKSQMVGMDVYSLYLTQRDLAARIGEACGVRLTDIDLTTGVVQVEIQLARQDKEASDGKGAKSSIQETATKSTHGVRPMLIGPELLEIARKRVDEERLKTALGQPGCPYLNTFNGGPWDKNYAIKVYGRVFEAAALVVPKGQKSHIIRRSMLNIIKRAPMVSSDTQALIAGHGDYAVTQNFYHTLDDSQKAELASASQYALSQVD